MERFKYRILGMIVVMPDGERKRFRFEGLTDDIERDRGIYKGMFGAKRILFTYESAV